jgi:hypothetical protein
MKSIGNYANQKFEIFLKLFLCFKKKKTFGVNVEIMKRIMNYFQKKNHEICMNDLQHILCEGFFL